MENIFIWDKYCALLTERLIRNEAKEPLNFSLADDEILVRTGLRLVLSHAALEIAYKRQLKNPTTYTTLIWGQYLPKINSERLTEIMKEELDLRDEILAGTNVYHMFEDGTSIFKNNENSLNDYLGSVVPDLDTTYTSKTQASIDSFYRVAQEGTKLRYVLKDKEESGSIESPCLHSIHIHGEPI